MTKLSIAIVSVLATASCSKDSTPQQAKPTGPSDRVSIAVTAQGFTPDDVTVPMGKPVTLVFERKTDDTCAKEVVLEVDGHEIRKALPLDQPVELVVTFPRAGKLTYVCGMDMVKGTVTVQ